MNLTRDFQIPLNQKMKAKVHVKAWLDEGEDKNNIYSDLFQKVQNALERMAYREEGNTKNGL